MNYFSEALHRIRQARSWIAAQFWGTSLILLTGIAWTRLPDQYAWEVLFSLLLPLVLLTAILVLEGGTIRKLIGQEEGRVPRVVGILTLLFWIALVWIAWMVLNWCDDRVYLWAGYLNSKASAGSRATFLTFDHIQRWFTTLIWIFRWIVLPAKVVPYAVASAQWGWRLPWRKVIRVLLDWRWWLAVMIAALAGVSLTGHFFAAEPQGTVSHQVWAVMFKLAGAYLLAVTSWIFLLVWAVVLFGRDGRIADQDDDEVPLLAPIGSGPLNEDAVRLPLPEGSGNVGRKA